MQRAGYGAALAKHEQSEVETRVKAREEDDAAYVEYVTGKALWMRRIAFLLCRDVDRADDLVQTSITKLYADWARIRRVSNLDGYTRTIIVNTFLAEQRSPWWRRVSLGHEAQLDASDGSLADLDLSLDLGEALTVVPPRQRAVLVLRFYCDMSVDEVAAALGCSAGNVKSQTSRGLATLREHLAIRPLSL
jgi:RNA polymerase sigma-70 factor (sigma-E family)